MLEPGKSSWFVRMGETPVYRQSSTPGSFESPHSQRGLTFPEPLPDRALPERLHAPPGMDDKQWQLTFRHHTLGHAANPQVLQATPSMCRQCDEIAGIFSVCP